MPKNDTKTSNKVKLTNTRKVAKFLAELINEVRDGEIDEPSAKTQGYLAQILVKALEQSDLEKRLEDLEKLVISSNKKS